MIPYSDSENTDSESDDCDSSNANSIASVNNSVLTSVSSVENVDSVTDKADRTCQTTGVIKPIPKYPVYKLSVSTYESSPIQSTVVQQNQNFRDYLQEGNIANYFLDELEQSLNAQAELLDRAILLSVAEHSRNSTDLNSNTEQSRGNIEVSLDNSDKSIAVAAADHTKDDQALSVSSLVDVGNSTLITESLGIEKITDDQSGKHFTSSFLGFSIDESNTSQRMKLLTDMQNIVADSRRMIRERRRQSLNADYRRQIWGYRQSSVSQNTGLDDSELMQSEASDILTELVTITPKTNRMLRSKGPVPDFPNVQIKTLEYKERGTK